MNRHEGVSCNHCSKVNFSGRRYKCLKCFDYDLCSLCYTSNASSDGHSPDHPLQCIICRSDYELYYGGEMLSNANIPQSLTCPYCAQMGFTDIALKEHVTDKHTRTTYQVICPICATTPTGDPNFMVSDLSRHLTVAHNVDSRRRISFIDEHINPHIATAPGLCARTNIQAIPAVHSVRSHTPVGQEPLSSASSSSRESTDPIDELIMQISRMHHMHNDTGLLNEHRERYATWQAVHRDLSASRAPQPLRENLFVIQSAIDVDPPAVVEKETIPNVPGYSALLPMITNQNEAEINKEENHEAKSEFVTQLIYSAMFYDTKKEDSKDNSNK